MRFLACLGLAGLTCAVNNVTLLQSYGADMKVQVDALLLDIATIEQHGLTSDTKAKMSHEVQQTILQGVNIQSYINQNIDTPIQPNVDSLVKAIDSIATVGLVTDNAARITNGVTDAIKNGLITSQDGLDIIDLIKKLISQGVTVADGALIANLIQTMLQKALSLFDKNPKVCKRSGFGRGVGSPLVPRCEAGEEASGALCYPKCKDGYEPVGCCLCRQKGCSGLAGAVDVGVSCSKPSAYGRGAGHVFREQCGDNCEKWGALWYPTCKPGFHNVGCCLCSPDCPAGTIDDGAFCRKDVYGRGVGKSRLGCLDGKDNSASLCYPPCATGQDGVGPMCWPTCGKDTPVNCGLFCTSTVATCISSVVEIVGSTTKIALSAVTQDYGGAIAAAVQLGAKMIVMPKC